MGAQIQQIQPVDSDAVFSGGLPTSIGNSWLGSGNLKVRKDVMLQVSMIPYKRELDRLAG